MAKSKNRGHRETRKPPREIPEVPDLGRLSMPRKSNRRAAIYVATVGRLWDRRRVARAAERRTRRWYRVDPPAHLDKLQREIMLATMPSWTFDRPSKTFMTDEVTPERFDELVHAVIGLGRKPIHLKIQRLSWPQFRELVEHLHEHSHLELVEQIPSPPRW